MIRTMERPDRSGIGTVVAVIGAVDRPNLDLIRGASSIQLPVSGTPTARSR